MGETEESFTDEDNLSSSDGGLRRKPSDMELQSVASTDKPTSTVSGTSDSPRSDHSGSTTEEGTPPNKSWLQEEVDAQDSNVFSETNELGEATPDITDSAPNVIPYTLSSQSNNSSSVILENDPWDATLFPPEPTPNLFKSFNGNTYTDMSVMCDRVRTGIASVEQRVCESHEIHSSSRSTTRTVN